VTLNKAKLKSDIESIFKDGSSKALSTEGVAEQRWASAYHAYASKAMDASNDMVASANQAGFRSALNFRVAKDSMTPLTIAQQLDLAFVSYWTGATFAVGIPPTPAAKCPSVGGNTIFSTEISSIVQTVIPGTLLAQLTPIVTQKSKAATLSDMAQQYADAFHTATTTAVLVFITGLDTTPPPAGPLSVFNLCTIS